MVEFLQTLIAPEGYSVSLLGALLPLIPKIASGIGSLIKGKDAGKTSSDQQSTSTSTGTSTGTQEGSFNNTSTSGLDAAGQARLDNLFGAAERLYASPTGVDPRVIDQNANAQAQDVNARAQGIFDSVQGNAIARGLGGPQGSGQALARGLSEAFRGSALNTVNINAANERAALPLLNQQIQQQRFGNLQNLLQFLPETQTSSGTSTGTTSGTTNTTGATNTTGNQQAGGQGGLLGNILGGAADFLKTEFPGRFGDRKKPTPVDTSQIPISRGMGQGQLPPNLVSQAPTIQNNQFGTRGF